MADAIPEYKPKADRAPNRGKAARSASAGGKLPTDRVFRFTLPQLQKALEDQLGLVILGLSTAGDMHCAEVLADGSEEMIKGWIWLAEKHTGFRRILEYICGGGGYAAVLTSTLGVALPIAQHHGLYPEGWPTPSSLFGFLAVAHTNTNGHHGEAGDTGTETVPED